MDKQHDEKNRAEVDEPIQLDDERTEGKEPTAASREAEEPLRQSDRDDEQDPKPQPVK